MPWKIRALVFTALVLASPLFGQKLAIQSISICSPAGLGGQAACPPGTLDTHQLVLAPDGSGNVINKVKGLGAMSDEHSSVFAPGTLGNNPDYLFFVASDAGGNPLGNVVMSGGAGPDKKGQWTFDLATADGYGVYSSGPGAVFVPAVGGRCPAVRDGNPAHQDATFDLSYAAGGSVVLDPTRGPGNLLLIFEGCNSCVGVTTNINPTTGSYISDAIATSTDYGRTWPTYRGTPSFPFVQLPATSKTGPSAGMGATGSSVCIGNDCTPIPPPWYGRYAVVSPQTTLSSLIARGQLLNDIVGMGELSGFLDDVSGAALPFVYIVHGYKTGTQDPPLPNGRGDDLFLARAQLNAGTAPLTFYKWNGTQFASPGLGGSDTPILPDGAYQNCGSSKQLRHQGAINYVDDTQQYLLTFLCESPTDPATGSGTGNAKGAAWFWSTSSTPSDPRLWSTPQEIIGTWGPFDNSGGCFSYKGYYFTMMSLGSRPGHLSKNGFTFYLWGCVSAGTPGGRQFSSRAFTMTLAPERHRAARH